MRWGLIVGLPVTAAVVVLAAHPWATHSGVGRTGTILSPVQAAPVAVGTPTGESAKGAPVATRTATATPAPTSSVVVPSCGAQLCQVPGTDVFAQPGTIYDPVTGETRAIPPLSPGYRAYLCRVEHVRCG